MKRNPTMTVPALPAVVMATVVLITASANAGETQLISALTALKQHVNGTAVLNASQIEAYKLTIDDNRAIFGDSASIISASFDLVNTYDSVIGPLWTLGSPTANGFSRKTMTNDNIHWAVFNVMQDIMDDTYTAGNLQTYPSLLGAFKFGSADNFPGHVDAPANPTATYTVAIDGSFLKSWGHDTMHWADRPARQPTGAYLAPGTIATITVPASLVGKGYQIRVEGHSWDFSNKDPIDRLDRCTLLYNINSTEVKVASPLGGSIYVEVPYLANAGVVDLQFQNVVQAPFFSMQSFHTTTEAQWQAMVNSSNRAPWADFQTDKFMMNVPTDWIYKMNASAALTLMQNWDKAMDIMNDLMGFPRIRGKETMFPQVDVRIRSSAYAPGYPAVNDTYNPDTNYKGTSTSNLIKGPQNAAYYEFHEQGHGYLFQKFPGETEAEVNILHVAVWNQGFGYGLDAALRGSMGVTNTFQTLDTTAIEWMASFSFVNKRPMDQLEKQYQLKGHAKFVEIARMFGWGVLGDYWRSFNEDYENGISYSTSTDSLLLRLSKNVGVDITPLFHFWGVPPQNASALKAAIAAADLPESQEIYDTLVHYKTLVPANNAAFRQYCLSWWGKQPSVTGYWTESEHAKQWDDTYGVIYDEGTAAAIQAVIDELLGTYFPGSFPTYPLGDLNLDGVVDRLDWPLFLAGNHADLSGLAREEAYLLGDLDGDGDNDIYDFAKFREAYELYHPAPGAFAAMVASYAPEPGSMLLLAAGAAGLAMRRRKRTRQAHERRSRKPGGAVRRKSMVAGCSGRSLLSLAAAAMAAVTFAAASAGAATMTNSPTAPTIDGQDIASYGTTTDSDKWWPDDATKYGNPGKTVGQTFATGSQGVRLNAITFQVTSGTQPTKTYAIRVGEVSGATFTTIASESATQDFVTANNDYWTWTLDTPVFLFPNTVYGVDVGLLTSSSEWETGIPYVYYTADVYPGGTRFRSGTAGYGIGDSSMTSMSGDRVFHLDLTAAEPPLLTLRVDPVTGDTAIHGYSTQAIDINYYEITSAGHSLDAVHWSSLADQDFEGGGPPNGTGNGWEEAGGAGNHALAEAFLLGNSTIAASQTVSLGKGYDVGVGAEDMAFTYRTDTGAILEGLVEYVTSVLPGDANLDGVVDAADYIALKKNFGKASGATYGDGDFDGDRGVDRADLLILMGSFSQGTGGAATIPEPATLALLGIGALALLRRRRSA